MAARLKSILKQTHWSLLLRAAVFALAWYLFTGGWFWLFALVALCIYFVPPFQAGRLLWPFVALMILAFIESPNLPFLIIFTALFYYLLLIKDLLLIDRKSAYEILIFALSFLLIRDFYRAFEGGVSGWGIWYAFLLAVLLGIMASRFMKAFSVGNPDDPDSANRTKHPIRRIAAWLTFLIAWQFLILGLFLPLDFVYQSAIIFLVLAIVIDFASGEYLGDMTRSKIFATSIAVFSFLVIILASARWGL
jgi:hypothetical protein